MRSRRISTWLAGAAVGLALSAPLSAHAGGLALDRFDPAPAGDRMLGVPSPFVAGHLTPHAMLLADYAHDPLILHVVGAGSAGAVVENQLFLHANASLALWDRLNINVDVPFATVQNGDNPAGAGYAYPSPSATHLGDIRLGLRVRLFGGYHDSFQIALAGYVWMPLGASSTPNGAYVSDGKVRGRPELVLGGRGDRYVWSAAIGPELRASQQIASFYQGSMFRVAAGGGVLLLQSRRLQIGPEATLAFAMAKLDKHNLNAEVLFDVRYRATDAIEVAVGAGPGLTTGIGTPDVRAVAMFAYSPEQKVPIADRDLDGIADAVDACPTIPGVASDDPAIHGCPARPPETMLAQMVEQDPAPAEPVVASEEGATAGDRTLTDAVLLTRTIHFETNLALIDPADAPTLDALALLIGSETEVVKIEVQGHTDSTGPFYTNTALSRARAEAVRKELIARGIDTKRLRTKGFGAAAPRAENETPEGRRQNRRVQLRILEKRSFH